MQAPKKYCKECKEEIHGRRDKQFCSDYCRASYYNNLHFEKTANIRRINNVLRRNRGILAQLNPGDRSIVHKHKLVESGFNFNYHTNHLKTLSGETYCFCYDQGYTEWEEEFYLIISKGKITTLSQRTLPTAINQQSAQQF